MIKTIFQRDFIRHALKFIGESNQKRRLTNQTKRLPYSNRRTELDWSVEENALQAVLPQIKEDILDDQLEDYINVPHIRQRYSNLLDKTTFDLPYRYRSGALATVHSYLQLEKFGNVTPEQLKLSCILGWCYRLQVSSMVIYDDILDDSKVRYNEQTWHEQVGTKEAILDTLFLQSSASYLLLRYLKSHPNFIKMFKMLNKCYATCAVGQTLEIQSYDLEDFHANEFLIKCFPCTLYPVRTAMYLANIVDPKLHFNVEEFCWDLARFIKVEDEMWGHFEPITKTHKDCTDASTGRVTWLGTQVAKYGTSIQKQIFSDNYGKNEETALRNIQNIYEEMRIVAHFKKFEEKFYNEMCERIENLPKELPKQLFVDLLDFAVIKKFRG
ncbi:farnesyl pyrophosphate synthase-like [Diabrotica virgifera virgifera]|uniref:Farnesyl pyrophosphate synthase-like n=2 Tax=Diabrotica virgifera virgifera TaxID=50390 RepID=A0ABM5KK04_DIAVI|nr:farnesyl pyrophosphate synthase-like [Diabrotica virgifera virgifera]